MSDVTQSKLLINALLDGELDAAEAERVSKQVADDEQLSEMLADFTAQRAAIAELPQYKLNNGDRFADRILEIASAEAAARPMPHRRPPSSVDWKRYAMTLAAIAGLLMGMLVYQWTPLSKPDGPTVAVLSSHVKADRKDQMSGQPATAGEPAEEAMGAAFRNHDQSNQTILADNTRQKPVLAKALPPSHLEAADVDDSVDSFEARPMRSESANSKGASQGIAGGVAAGGAKDANRFSAGVSAVDLPPPSAISFSGTPMTAPQDQSQAAIDQVWLLEVDARFSQSQLLEALTSNSISVPPELKRASLGAVDASEKVQQPEDVEGIHVAARALQMKNALSQLSQSDAVTISAFQLQAEAPKQEEADQSLTAGKESDAPLSIQPAQQPFAQKLRANYFAQQAKRPSSLVPESFDKLEQKMGIKVETVDADADPQNTGEEQVSGESDQADKIQPPSEMEQLFPGEALESDRMQNFVILIRNQSPAKK